MYSILHGKKFPIQYIKIAGIILFFIFAFFSGNQIGNNLLARKKGITEVASPAQSNVPSSIAMPFAKGLPKAPSADASDAEKASFAVIIHQTAKMVTSAHIGKNCVLDPLIIRTIENQEFTFINEDTSMHRIVIGTSNIEVGSRQRKVITARFQNGTGIYGVACDDITAGFMEIAPKEK